MDAAENLPRLMSLDEFLSWDSADGLTYQLIDGQPRAMAPTTVVHGAIQSELGGIIRDHLLASRSTCVVVSNPGVVPKVRADQNARIPDLAVTCSATDLEQQLLSDPVVIVEILFPSNHAETWANVWTYTTIPSVSEILVVRTANVGADLLRRQPDGGWPDRPLVIEPSDDLVLQSIGLSRPLAALYRTAPRVAPRPG